MNILNYYISMQNNEKWYLKFQSTSSKQSGKTFSYINTNFRSLLSFATQFEAFQVNVGKDRNNWEKWANGQEIDKHRVANMLNANFYVNEENTFRYTAKGLVLKDWLSMSPKKNDETWIILFLLLLDYRSESRPLDLLKTTKEIFELFKNSDYDEKYISNELEKNIRNDKKIKIFSEDIFWLISFVRDKTFIDLYKSSTELERQGLKNYVINCSDNPKTRDCIAHKFIPGGSYQASTFNDDVKTLYYSHFILKSLNLSFDNIIDKLIELYCDTFAVDGDYIKKFIFDHKSVFNNIFCNVKKGGLS